MSKGRLRHSLAVRGVHWAIALSGLGLLFTGMGELPMYKRYNVVLLPGLHWAGDFELHLVLHYFLAAIFTAAAFFHLVYHWRRREFAAWPRRGDLRESVAILSAIIRGKEEPPHGKFLAEQRIAYAAIAVTSALLVVTGLVKTWKNLGAITIPPAVLQTITLLHTGATMVFFLLVLMHLAAFLLPANLPLLPSMLSGRVSEDYARRRHSLWNDKRGRD